MKIAKETSMLHWGRRDFMKAVGLGLALRTSQTAWADGESGRSSPKMPSESFVEFLRAYGEARPPSLTYREGDDFAAWQRTFRSRLEELRGPVPDRVAAEVEVLETIELADHHRLLIRFPVTRFSRLVAYLLLPKGLGSGEKRPGIIALHGHHTGGIETICGVRQTDYDPYALRAVRAGFVVLAPAWWGWPGRDGHVGQVGDRDRCNVIQMAASMYGLHVLSLHIQDGQAAIDVLSSRPEVDSSNIGCIGNSYGGRTTMWLTVFDDRIKACVPAGCMNCLRERSLKLSSCAIQYFHGLLRYGDVQEVFSLIPPRAMQLQAGQGDSLITNQDRDMIKTVVEKAYILRQARANFEYVLHEKGHQLGWDAAEPFLRAHLGLTVG
jgi:dienelactone hydrolase